MNRANIRRVARAIATAELAKRDKNPIGFNMGFYNCWIGSDADGDKTGHGCNTVGCVAGWTDFIFHPRISKFKRDNDEKLKQRATAALGLSPEVANKLFEPYGIGQMLSTIQPIRVVAVLYHLAETGVVDWNIAK